MQPSYLKCKYCGYVLSEKDFPASIIGRTIFPTDDEKKFEQLKAWAKQNLECPCCGNKAYIRKAYYKV